MFFLHLLEQVHCTCPSFLTSMIPCPLEICLPQKEQLRRDVAVLLIYQYHLILRASRSVSLSIKISFILTEPLTFLVRILPLSFPSRTLTRTCMTSPAIPVLPTICMTSAGTTFSSAALLLICQSASSARLPFLAGCHSSLQGTYGADNLFNNVLSFASVDNS